MNDSYSELLVKKEQTFKDKLLKYLIITLLVFAVIAAVIVTPFAWIVVLGLGAAVYFVLPNLDLEFEYVYVNGELDIDKIASRAKRKRVISLDLSKLDIMAPVKSHRMDYHNHNTKIKVLDYSSGNPSHNIYAMIIPDKEQLCKILLEPDKELLENIEKSCPRKVFTD